MHSDSNASFEADEKVAGRVDSVALAKRRMSKLGQAENSVTVAKRRQHRDKDAAAEEAAAARGSAAEAISGGTCPDVPPGNDAEAGPKSPGAKGAAPCRLLLSRVHLALNQCHAFRSLSPFCVTQGLPIL